MYMTIRRFRDTERHAEYERRKTSVMLTDGDVSGRDIARFVAILSERVEQIEDNVVELSNNFAEAIYGKPDLNFSGVIEQLKSVGTELKSLKEVLNDVVNEQNQISQTVTKEVHSIRKMVGWALIVVGLLLVSFVLFIIFA